MTDNQPDQCDLPCCAYVSEPQHPTTVNGNRAIHMSDNVCFTNSPILSPYFSYLSTWEKLLKFQESSPWVIISLHVILMTSEVE